MIMSKNYNGSGCLDPTAAEAIENVCRSDQEKADQVLRQIEDLVDQAGYVLVFKVVIRDKKTWRKFKRD